MGSLLQWIEIDTSYSFDDLVYWHRRGREGFVQAAPRIDTIVLGPHASAAFPRELEPFVSPALTRRKQADFSDLVTSALGRAWAGADPHVVFVENPVSRLVLDPNRAPPADPIADLREFYARLRRQRAGEKVGFGGVDAIRPVTFSGEDVLLEPQTPAAWDELADALHGVIANTVKPYQEACERVVQEVLAASPSGPLRLVSLHDTMNTQMRADGAICVGRREADRLPVWVNFGNKGDARGEAAGEPITMDAGELRRLAAAWAEALEVAPADRAAAFRLNAPYKGSYEVTHFGECLMALGRPALGAVQVEFRRESLLGPIATAYLQEPGEDWPAPDGQHLDDVVEALVAAGASLRQ